MKDWIKPFSELTVGKGRKIRDGKNIAIVSIGHIGHEVEKASTQLETEGITVAHYDIRFLKPIDEELLHEIFTRFNKVITIEDGTITGGLGSAVLEFMSDHHYRAEFIRLGIPDRFIDQGSIGELQRECGYDSDGIVKQVLNFNF
jgi:1-deoxy-D-xylulose-5-phosphate synthase